LFSQYTLSTLLICPFFFFIKKETLIPISSWNVFSFFREKYSVYMILHIVCTRCKLAITCYVVIRMPTVQRLDLSRVCFTQHFPWCNVFISSSLAHRITFIYSYCFAFALRFSFALHLLTNVRKSSSSSICSSSKKTRFIFTSIMHGTLDAVDFTKWGLFTIAHLIYSKLGNGSQKACRMYVWCNCNY